MTRLPHHNTESSVMGFVEGVGQMTWKTNNVLVGQDRGMDWPVKGQQLLHAIHKTDGTG